MRIQATVHQNKSFEHIMMSIIQSQKFGEWIRGDKKGRRKLVGQCDKVFDFHAKEIRKGIMQ